MDVSFSKGKERQEAGKHQQRINSGVNSFSLVPLVPLLLVNEALFHGKSYGCFL